jgi:hypothetical protein
MYHNLSGGRCLLALMAATIAATASQPASAGMATLDFVNITNNGSTNVASQLKVVVADQFVDLNTLFPSVYANTAANEIGAAAAGHLRFIFTNLGTTASAISEVYFDDGTLLGISSIFGSTGVNFTAGAAPPDLPGGNSLPVPFNVTAGFLAEASTPPPMKGVNPGEWLVIDFNMINGHTFATTQAALAQAVGVGGLRIGMHVISIDGDDSDSFVNRPPTNDDPNTAVPEPASCLLAAIGGLGAMMIGRRRRTQAA